MCDWIGVTHKFHFTTNPADILTMHLPTGDDIDGITSNAVCIFDLEICCDYKMTGTLRIWQRTGAIIYNHEGNPVQYYEMNKGDYLHLRYYDRRYIICGKNW